MMFLQQLIDKLEEAGGTDIILSVEELESFRDAEQDRVDRVWGLVEKWMHIVSRYTPQPTKENLAKHMKRWKRDVGCAITDLREEFLSTKRPKKRTKCLKDIANYKEMLKKYG